MKQGAKWEFSSRYYVPQTLKRKLHPVSGLSRGGEPSPSRFPAHVAEEGAEEGPGIV